MNKSSHVVLTVDLVNSEIARYRKTQKAYEPYDSEYSKLAGERADALEHLLRIVQHDGSGCEGK